jgi:hypothetical protein
MLSEFTWHELVIGFEHKGTDECYKTAGAAYYQFCHAAFSFYA